MSDSFTQASNANLQSHTGETGATWTIAPGLNRGNATDDATLDRIYASNTSAEFCMYYASGSPLGAEYDVLADMVCVTQPAAAYAEVCGRVSTSVETLYEAGWEQGTGWVLYKGVAGAYTALQTSAFTPTNGVTYALKLQIRDAAKKLFVDGVEKLTSADNAITAAGKAGLDLHIASSTTGLHLDNYQASDPASATKAPPPARRAQRVWYRTRRL